MISEKNRNAYINQIKRLQERNNLLAEVLSEERKLRKNAYSWYMKRLGNKFLWIFDYILLRDDILKDMDSKL